MKILHLDSSVTGEKSVSRSLTAIAAERLKSQYPDAEYIYRDLVNETLRHYTAVLRIYGDNVEQTTPEQKQEFALGKQILEEFLSADIVLVGAPMYNLSVPSQLKAWIDHIVVPGVTFKYGAKGAEGQCGGKRVIILSTRGGQYGPGTSSEPYDFQEKYMRAIFGFLGVQDVTVITAEGIARGPEIAAAAIAGAKAAIANLS